MGVQFPPPPPIEKKMSKNSKAYLYRPFEIKHPTKKMIAEAKMNNDISRNLRQQARFLGEIVRRMVLDLVSERGNNGQRRTS